jgi:hypothetical protein
MRSQVTQHLKTKAHVKNIEIQNNRAHHLFLMASFEKQGKLSQSSLDMCEAFNAADIPLSKLSNLVFRAWLERETKRNVPHESTLRKQYLDIVYENTMSFIRNMVKNRKIWICIDETIDAIGRKVANVIVGILLPDRSGERFLLTTEELEKCDAEAIARIFHDSLKLLGDINADDVLLFVTDGVPYMVKAGDLLIFLVLTYLGFFYNLY